MERVRSSAHPRRHFSAHLDRTHFFPGRILATRRVRRRSVAPPCASEVALRRRRRARTQRSGDDRAHNSVFGGAELQGSLPNHRGGRSKRGLYRRTRRAGRPVRRRFRACYGTFRRQARRRVDGKAVGPRAGSRGSANTSAGLFLVYRCGYRARARYARKAGFARREPPTGPGFPDGVPRDALARRAPSYSSVSVLLPEALSAAVHRQSKVTGGGCGRRLSLVAADGTRRHWGTRRCSIRSDRRLRAGPGSEAQRSSDMDGPDPQECEPAFVQDLRRAPRSDRPHRFHAIAVFSAATARDACGDASDLRAARGVVRYQPGGGLADGPRGVAADDPYLRADGALLRAFAAVGSRTAGGRDFLLLCDLAFRVAVLAGTGRPMEGPSAGADKRGTGGVIKMSPRARPTGWVLGQRVRKRGARAPTIIKSGDGNHFLIY